MKNKDHAEIEMQRMARKRLEALAPDLLAACKFALEKLNQITTKEFSEGGDREIRDRLRKAIDRAAGKNETD